MSVTTKFCLPADVQAHLVVGSNWTDDDAQITTHIKTATALIRKFTRRSWEAGTYTQYFNSQDLDISINQGSGVAKFQLNERPVTAVTAVKFNTAGDFANTDTLDVSNYQVDTDQGTVIMYPGSMAAHARALQIVYTAGYDVNGSDAELLDVDENLKQACAIQAAHTWQRVLNQTSGKSQKQDQKGFAIYKTSASGLVGEAQALLRGEARLLVGSYG